MINKAKEDEIPVEKETGYIDVAYVDMQCHILIKDKDTGEILVNKRG